MSLRPKFDRPHTTTSGVSRTQKAGLFMCAFNWILDQYDFPRWQSCGDSRLFGAKGDPGKGKIMLLITIVDELGRQLKVSEQQESTALLYFLC